eukprot:819332-Prorocentrum_minimum.AAC.2
MVTRFPHRRLYHQVGRGGRAGGVGGGGEGGVGGGPIRAGGGGGASGEARLPRCLRGFCQDLGAMAGGRVPQVRQGSPGEPPARISPGPHGHSLTRNGDRLP